jgi:hypothetical protein
MRSLITLIAVLSMIATSSRGFAQHHDVSPQTMSIQIREQETIAKTASGDRSWEAWLKLAVLQQDAARYRESEEAYLRTVGH